MPSLGGGCFGLGDGFLMMRAASEQVGDTHVARSQLEVPVLARNLSFQE